MKQKTLPAWAQHMAKSAFKMNPETSIEDHKKEVEELMEEQPDMAKIMELTMKEYARECAKASLEKAADNANAGFNPFNSTCFVEKITITNPENIVLC